MDRNIPGDSECRKRAAQPKKSGTPQNRPATVGPDRPHTQGAEASRDSQRPPRIRHCLRHPLSLMYGIGAWVEHPGFLPKHATLGAPSMWSLEQIQRLVAAPCVKRHQVNHNDFGGLAVKPTGILAIRLATLESLFKENKHHVPPQAHFKGTDTETGAWKTAVAKEYHTRLSATLARAMIDQLLLHLTSHHEVDKTVDQQHLHQSMPPLDPYLSDQA